MTLTQEIAVLREEMKELRRILQEFRTDFARYESAQRSISESNKKKGTHYTLSLPPELQESKLY